MRRNSASRVVKLFSLTTLIVATLAYAAPTITPTPATVNHKARRLSGVHRRAIVQPEDEDYAEEAALMAEDDAEDAGLFPPPVTGGSTAGGAGGGSASKTAEVLKTSGQTGAAVNSGVAPEGSLAGGPAGSPKASSGGAAGFHLAPTSKAGTPTKAPLSTSEITAWMRPDRIKFDGVQAPFVVPDDKAVTWYKIGEEGGATTIAAQQIQEITNYLGETVTATIGDVMIFQDGAVAEAIGSVMPNGKRGELYNIIACNVQSAKGKCIMVDYDGRDVKETLSKIVTGSTSTVAVAAATDAPPALSQWAENVMVLKVSTVTARAQDRRKRSQSSNRL